MSTHTSTLPVAVIGAGPVGPGRRRPARRARPAVRRPGGRRHRRLLDRRSGPTSGCSRPWRYNIDPAARALLEATGWTAPDPAAAAHRRRPDQPTTSRRWPRTRRSRRTSAYGAAVTAVTRQGFDRVRTTGRENAPFLVRLSDGTELLARAVIDASGTWRTPNLLGGNGIPAHGEAEARAGGRVFDGMPDVLGRRATSSPARASPSSAPATRPPTPCSPWPSSPTQEPDTSVHWVVRAPNPSRAYGGGAADALPARGAIGTRCPSPRRARHSRPSTPASSSTRSPSDGVVSADGPQGRPPTSSSTPPAPAPTTPSPPSCAWTSTRSSAPPARWPR